MILLDQIILQQQCIFFRLDNKILDIPDLFHKHPRLITIMLFVEIR